MSTRREAQLGAMRPTAIQRGLSSLLDWHRGRSEELKQGLPEPFIGPQQPWIDKFKRAVDKTTGLGETEGLPQTPREAQMRALQGTLGVGGELLGAADPADEATALAAREFAEKAGLGETGQGVAELLAGLASGAGVGDVRRGAQLLGSPEVLEKITRDVVDPIAKKFKPESETAQAMQRVLTGPRPINVAEEAQVTRRGRDIGGLYGTPARRTIPGERHVRISTHDMPDRPFARNVRRHETGGHAVYEELPFEIQEELTRATKKGELPLNPGLIKSPSYLKLPDRLKANENWAAWQDDFLSGKLEWDAGQLARAPENLEFKRASKALEYFRGLGAVPGQSIPITGTTRRSAQRRALHLP